MSFRILLTAAVATAALSSSAFAAGVEPNGFNDYQHFGPHTINQGGAWYIADTDGDGVTIQFDCIIDGGVGDAIAVGFQECYLEGADGARYFPPGRITTVPGSNWMESGVAENVRRQRYRLCVRTEAFFSDGTPASATKTCRP